MKRKLLALFFVFFLTSVSQGHTMCCDWFAIKFPVADESATKMREDSMQKIIDAVTARGEGVRKTLNVANISILDAILSMDEHVTMSFAMQSDNYRRARFEVNQALNAMFGLGLLPCCEVGNGIAEGNRNAWIYSADLTQGMAQRNLFKSGRESANFKQGLQVQYGSVNFIEPSGLMYTPKEREAAQNVFGGLADMFPPVNTRTAKEGLSAQAQADYDGAVQARQWLLDGARFAPITAWITYNSAIIPAESWLKMYKTRTGLHNDVQTQNGNISPKALNRLKSDEMLAMSTSSDRLELNIKGLYVELLKMSSEQYSVDVDMLLAVKRLPLQLALQNNEVLKTFEEYLQAFKTQKK